MFLITPTAWSGEAASVLQVGLSGDRRGNRILDYGARCLSSDRSRVWILLRACELVADHVRELLTPCANVPQLIPATERDHWTHAFELSGKYTRNREDRLNLLSEILLLPPPPELDLAFALDFYKAPDDGDPSQWPDTPAGALVNRLKYHGDISAGRDLAVQMAAAVQRHPHLAAADVVLAAPSTSSGLSERLGATVAKNLSVDLATVRRMASGGDPAKEGTSGDPRDCELAGGSVTNRVVLVVDDVYRSGGTMRGVAAAARASGAAAVFGIVGARTMRLH